MDDPRSLGLRPEPGPVLIVEDDPDGRETLALLIQHLGYAVEVAENGAEALRRVKQTPHPCLIVLDLRMPVLDGWQFRHHQRLDPTVCDIPVILHSAYTEQMRQQAASMGVSGILTKPAPIGDLARYLEQYAAPCRREGQTS